MGHLELNVGFVEKDDMSEDNSLKLVVLDDIDLVDTGGLNVSELVWTQKYGTPIKLGDMSDHHLRSTALMLMGMGYQKYRVPDQLKIKWLTAIRMEWEKRMRERNVKPNKASQDTK